MRKTRQQQSLKVGYINGAESFPLMMVAIANNPSVLKRPIELIEFVGLLSLRRAFERGHIDFALMDSVEAFRISNGEVRTGLLVRGCEVRIVVSDRIRQLGGAAPQALTHLFHHRILNKVLKIGVADVGGSVELYSMEFVRSVGRNWIEQIHLPGVLLAEALNDGVIDGYFQLDRPSEDRDSASLVRGRKNEIPSVRREMALVAEKDSFFEQEEDYVALVAAMLEGQEKLSSGDYAAALSEFSAIPAEWVAGEIREVFRIGREYTELDPGVLSNSMSGGLIEPVSQWEIVVAERLKRHSSCQSDQYQQDFIVEGVVSKARSLLRQ